MAVPHRDIRALCGAFAGSWFAAKLAGGDLKRLFGFFLLAMSVYEMFRKGKKSKREKR